MNNTRNRIITLAASVALAMTAMAQVAYDNAVQGRYQGFAQGSAFEFGDEIQLNLAAGMYPLASFSFEFYAGNFTPAVSKTAVLRLYNMDGGVNSQGFVTPGSPIWESPAFPIIPSANGFGTMSFDLSRTGVTVPNNFTWTVSSSGLAQGETFLLPVYDPPGVGESAIDFWVNGPSEWQVNLIDNGNIPANFAAKVTIVPEPTTLSLALIAGAGWLGLVALRRRS